MSLNRVNSVTLGNSMFLAWEDIDVALDRWARGYFGEHAEGVGSRDEDDFEVSLGGLTPDDYEKYVALFEAYDKEKDYEPDDEGTFGDYGTILPSEMTKRLMVDILRESGLKSYGTALATYDGVFFMEHDRHEQKENERAVEVAEGSGWKVEPEVDELVVRMAHYSGAMEARKEIEPMEWDDLCGAIRDAIKEYYDNPSETNPFQADDIAEKVLRERFGAKPDTIKPLEDVLTNANRRVSSSKLGEADWELEP